jgi:hypothetical protein
MPFRTSDLYQASFIHAKGGQLLNVEAGEYGRLVFVFEDGDSIEIWVREFRNDGMINSQRFISSLRTLKGICQNPYGNLSYGKRGR